MTTTYIGMGETFFIVEDGKRIPSEVLKVNENLKKRIYLEIDKIVEEEEIELVPFLIVIKAIKDVTGLKILKTGMTVNGIRYEINDSKMYLEFKEYAKKTDKIRRRFLEQRKKTSKKIDLKRENIKTKEGAEKFKKNIKKPIKKPIKK